MIAGKLSRSWQVIIADLALILFMVTAAAMKRDREELANDPLPVRGEPVAIYREAKGAPPVRQWLADQAPDARQRLTIVARHTPGRADEAATAALALAAEAGTPARIVIEPSSRNEALAVLAFDRGGNWHADCTGNSLDGAQRAPGKESPCE